MFCPEVNSSTIINPDQTLARREISTCDWRFLITSQEHFNYRNLKRSTFTLKTQHLCIGHNHIRVIEIARVSLNFYILNNNVIFLYFKGKIHVCNVYFTLFD